MYIHYILRKFRFYFFGSFLFWKSKFWYKNLRLSNFFILINLILLEIILRFSFYLKPWAAFSLKENFSSNFSYYMSVFKLRVTCMVLFSLAVRKNKSQVIQYCHLPNIGKIYLPFCFKFIFIVSEMALI